jgi:hypothetical protein
MLSILRKKCGIEVNEVFFSREPAHSSSSSSVCFFVQAAKPLSGFHRFQTPIIDLRQQAAVLFSRISSGTRYKIRRAEREGIGAEFNQAPVKDAIHEFVTFFDEFAKHKGLPRCNKRKLLALHERQALIITCANHPTGRCLVMHAYIADHEERRLRLLYSASHFRGTEDTEQRNLIGRANRLLHWSEIQHAQKAGFEVYDLGGLPVGTEDPAKNAIARFKIEFGGTPIIEYNGYTSRYPLIRYAIPTLQRLFA